MQFDNHSTLSSHFSGLKISAKLFWPCKQNASGTASKQTLDAEVSGKRPVGRPRTRWPDCIEDLGWNRLGFPPSEMQSVLVNREVWRLNLKLVPAKPSRKNGLRKKIFYFHAKS